MLRGSAAAAAVLLSAGAAAGANAPVIILPGLLGSAVEVRLDGTQEMPHIWCQSNTNGEWLGIWVDPGQMVPTGKDCLFKRLAMTYDPATDQFGNLPGIEVRTSGTDGFAGAKLLYHFQYDPMFNKLRDTLGYELEKDVFVAPFDWRLAADTHAKYENGVGGFFEELRLRIESAVSSNEGRRAVMVTHSLGCLNLLYFFHNYVSDDWRAQYIDSWVALGGPWMGVPMTMLTYLGGYNLGAPDWLVPDDYIRPLEVNTSSALWLSAHPLAYGDEPLAKTPSRSYTAADLADVIAAIGESVNADNALAILRRPSMDLLPLQKPPKYVPLQNWYSPGVKTARQFIYDQDVTEGFNHPPSQTIFGPGDGTVPVESATWPHTQWPQDPTAPVSFKEFPNVAHFNLIQDKDVLQALSDYLGTVRASGSLVV